MVGVGKGGTGHRLDFQEVEALYPGFQAAHAIPQADPGRELHGEEMHQLAPAAKRPGLPAGGVIGFQLGKMMSRNKFEHLGKDCVTMGHSQIYPFYLVSYA